MSKKVLYLIFVLFFAAGLSVLADQYDQPQQKETSAEMTGKATLTAELVDQEQLAAKKMATVRVTVSGVELAQLPMHETSRTKPVGGTMKSHSGAHIHFQLDDGPIIVSPVTELSFAELTPGEHTLKITASSADHKPISETKTLTFNIQ
jgi:hypothetical protein